MRMRLLLPWHLQQSNNFHPSSVERHTKIVILFACSDTVLEVVRRRVMLVVTQETEALLPAVATLLRATPDEFRALRSVMGASTWWPALSG